MTREEHMLILTMLAKQQQTIKAMGDLLRSRDLASEDDLKAFEFAATQDTPANAVLLRRVKGFYLRMARQFGVQTGLAPLT